MAGLAKPRRLVERHSIGFVLQFRFKFNFQLFFTEPQRMAKLVPQRQV